MNYMAFVICLGFAVPSYADQVGGAVTVPVTVTVSGMALCSFDATYCDDESVSVVEETEE